MLGRCGSRIFTAEDQERFARMSGDRNPMHMDAIAARRTQAGGRAVHGMHAMLWALERLADSGVPIQALAAIKVDFNRFLHLDRPVTLEVLDQAPDFVRAALTVEGASAVALDLRFGAAGAPPAPAPLASLAVPVPDRPATPAFATLASSQGRLGLVDGAKGLAAEMFPNLSGAVGDDRVATLGLASALVGMVLPGLHSIFAGLSLEFVGGGRPGDGLGYRVISADDRFRFVTIDVTAPGLAGTIRAFVRFPPIGPPTLAQVAGLVRSDEFGGRRALVVGGSRGLGAVTATLIAAGGGTVTITYRNGRDEAESIRDEIAAVLGSGRAFVARYDAGAPPAAQFAELEGAFTHAYYFATGRIFEAGSQVFDRDRFAAFVEIYVDGFVRLVEHLLARTIDGRITVLYPSSVYVAKRPAQLTEYAMAKAAGEILVADLVRAHRGLTISAPRLPRVLTDQSATIPPVSTADPVEVMLPLLRAEGP